MVTLTVTTSFVMRPLKNEETRRLKGERAIEATLFLVLDVCNGQSSVDLSASSDCQRLKWMLTEGLLLRLEFSFSPRQIGLYACFR